MAVTAIRTDAVPTAACIGTPQASTISGTRKEPPETPTIPAANPVTTATTSTPAKKQQSICFKLVLIAAAAQDWNGQSKSQSPGYVSVFLKNDHCCN
jgi:hypothetical protein